MSSSSAPLVVFAFRFCLETVPQAREAIVRIVRYRIQHGASPLEKMSGVTPMAVVWHTLGQTDPWTRRFLDVLLEYFAARQDMHWSEGVCIAALLGGWDVSKITNWADCVEVEEVCAGFEDLQFNFPVAQ